MDVSRVLDGNERTTLAMSVSDDAAGNDIESWLTPGRGDIHHHPHAENQLHIVVPSRKFYWDLIDVNKEAFAPFE